MPASEVSPNFSYPPVRAGDPRATRRCRHADRHGTQVTGDGMGILQHDSYLGQHRGHLAYRCALPTRRRGVRVARAPASRADCRMLRLLAVQVGPVQGAARRHRRQ